MPEITADAQDMVLTCKNGKFGDKVSIKMNYDNSGVHQCKPENDEECTDATCATALIKILSEYYICPTPISLRFNINTYK